MLDLEFAEITDIGRVRRNNEDALGHVLAETPAEVQSQGWFFALADGMGGHDLGEVASKLAIDTAVEGFRKVPKGIMHVSLLPKLVQEANSAVFEAGLREGAGSTRMGTTFVGCALRFDSAVVSHVGDSRCYLFRGRPDGQLTVQQLTHDHTMVAEQVRMGLLTQQEADTGAGRHLLTRCLGLELFVAADTITVNVMPGDILMLCSDGLHGSVSDREMATILKAHPILDGAAKALVAAANAAGGPDNISVSLIRIRSVERMGLYRGRPYRLL